MANEPLYTITNAIKRTKFLPGGQMKEVMEINFITKSGIRDNINVDEEAYFKNPDVVKADIQKRAEVHEGLMT